MNEMKKTIRILLLSLFSFILCSCGNVEKENFDVNKIYEVDHKQYNEEKEFNHKHLISGTPEILFDKNVQLEKNFIINGMELKLKYNRTLRYDIGNECLLEYFVDGDEEKVILLSDDGKIDSILYDYTVLEISKTTNSDEVLELLKNELRKFVDISFYSNVTVDETEYLSGTNYDYLFFNNENGYMTDFLRASVDVDGNVYAVKFYNLKATDHLKVDVDKEKEQQAIELKLKDIYNTEITQYKSYEEVFDPRIVIYEDQLYVEYFVAATYTHEQHGERSSYINTLLIPLEMINN